MVQNELYHFGVKGMQWGVRRYQNADGSLTAAGKRRQAKMTYKEEKKVATRNFTKGADELKKSGRANDYDAVMKNAGKFDKEFDAATDKYKKTITRINKSAVKNYQKKYNEAVDAEDLADEKWTEVNEQYKALGKNRVQRMFRAAKNDTAEAKAYNKAYNEASKASDLADQKWNEVDKAYLETGRNRVEMILNNIKYGK